MDVQWKNDLESLIFLPLPPKYQENQSGKQSRSMWCWNCELTLRAPPTRELHPDDPSVRTPAR